MRKKTIKIPVWNILFSLLFVFGFFAGTIMAAPSGIIADLSANAIIDVEIEPQKKQNKNIKTLSIVLPVVKETTEGQPSNSPLPQYNTNAPILASNSDEKIRIKNDTSYEINTDKILSEPFEIKGGKVLILHTHTSEAYTKTADADYAESDPYRTQESEKNIVAVGREIADVLRENGIEVVHDETYHDYPSYTGSYRRALETAQKNISESGEFSLILDIHRDALLNENGEYMKTMAKINGEEMAQALLVIGTNGGGLEHPDWKNNLKTALNLQKIMKEKYPPLARDLHLCNERYNGHMGDGAMIIEIGSNGNTLPQAIKCARLVGECIVSLIKN